MAEAAADGKGVDVAGVLVEKAFPCGGVGGVADGGEDAGTGGAGVEGGIVHWEKMRRGRGDGKPKGGRFFAERCMQDQGKK